MSEDSTPYIPESVNAVTRVGLDLFFNGDIDFISISRFAEALAQLREEIQEAQLKGYKPPDSINLYVTSYGGIISAALIAVDLIESFPIPIHTVALGIVASAGVLLTLSGKVRYVGPSCRLLIHELSQGIWGTHSQLKTFMLNADALAEFLENFLLSHTKFKRKKLRKLLSKDLLLYPEQAVKYGLADKIGLP